MVVFVGEVQPDQWITISFAAPLAFYQKSAASNITLFSFCFMQGAIQVTGGVGNTLSMELGASSLEEKPYYEVNS